MVRLATCLIPLVAFSVSAHADGFWKYLKHSSNREVRKIVEKHRESDGNKAALYAKAREWLKQKPDDLTHTAAAIIFVEYEYHLHGERRLLELSQGFDENTLRSSPDEFLASLIDWQITRAAASRIRDFLLTAPAKNFFSQLPMDERMSLVARVANTVRDKGNQVSAIPVKVVASAVQNLGTDVELTSILRHFLVAEDAQLRRRAQGTESTDLQTPHFDRLLISSRGVARLEYQDAQRVAGWVYARSVAQTLGGPGLAQAVLQDECHAIRKFSTEYAYEALSGKTGVSEIETLSPQQKIGIARAMFLVEEAEGKKVVSALRALGDTEIVRADLEQWSEDPMTPLNNAELKALRTVLKQLGSCSGGLL